MSGPIGTGVKTKSAAKAKKPEPPDLSDVPAQVAADAAAEADAGEKAPDPPPRKRRSHKKKQPKAKAEPTDGELTELLEELLSLPAVPIRMFLGCEYCAKNTVEEAPGAARELMAMAKENPAFRRGLVQMAEWLKWMMRGSAFGAYLGRPLIHHVVPKPALQMVGPIMGVPTDRPDNVINLFPRKHEHGDPAQGNGSGAPGAPDPSPEPTPPAAA